MLENTFQARFIEELLLQFPEAYVLKNDPEYIQGFPDLLFLYQDKWAAFECKKSKNAPYRPNQEYYLNELDNMSFARTVYPENMEEVLDELQSAFASRRSTRFSKR